MRIAVPHEIDATSLATWRRGAEIVDMGGDTMGTTWRVKIASPLGFDPAAMQRAIEARLEAIVAQMSHWREDSLLGRFNRAAGGQWFALPADFAYVLQAAFEVAERSSGAFDPTIGAVVNLWGHGPVKISRPPPQQKIAAALDRAGMARLRFDAANARIQQPGGLQLDLSGIAKGFAVDALAALLRRIGCEHALVEIGGELAGLGLRPDGDPWWVDLETPGADVSPMRLALHQLSVATSGDYVRGFHTIDPRTGQPVEHAMAVSVIHCSAMLADAWATALSVLPPPDMMALATRQDLKVRALSRDPDVREWLSPSLASMLEGAG